MGHRCCSKQKVKRGLWSPEEDDKLVKHITTYGHGSWSSVPKLAGLQRCGKSCRLRWINYLRPDLKRGSFTADEEQIIIDVHRILGNRWAQIAKHLPGRTDNEVKNFWNSCIKKKLISQGLDPKTHNLLSSRQRASAANKNASTSQTNQQSFTVFSITSHKDVPIAMGMMEPPPPPVVTLPPKQPPPPPPPAPPANPDLFSSSSSLSSIQLSGFTNLIDENPCIWDANAIVESFEEPIVEGILQPEERQDLQQEKEKICEMGREEVNEINGSFEISCSFDHGFLESTLMSEAMCRDLDSMDGSYDFAWSPY